MTQLNFHYRAIDQRGGIHRGHIEARDQSDAYRRLVTNGMRPLRLHEVRRVAMARRERVPVRDLAHFSYQFAVLMEARIPIADGLRSIADQERNTYLRGVIQEVARSIESGRSVIDSLAPHRRVFGDVYVETIRAAERSASLPAALMELGRLLERRYESQKEVRAALTYPACVLCALMLAVGFLMIFVVPNFAGMFASRDLELPRSTKLLIASGTYLRSYGLIVLGGCLFLMWLWRGARASTGVRALTERIAWHVPIIGPLMQALMVGRFVHVFGMSLNSGLNLLEAIDLSGRASGSVHMRSACESMRSQVNQGRRLSDVIDECKYLPSFARRMIASGEESSRLPEMCDIVARHYDREVRHLAKSLTTVIEPLLIVSLSCVVLLIALAIFLPMWNMTALLG